MFSFHQMTKLSKATNQNTNESKQTSPQIVITWLCAIIKEMEGSSVQIKHKIGDIIIDLINYTNCKMRCVSQ